MTGLSIEHEDAGGSGQFFLRRNGERCGTLDYFVSPENVLNIEYVEVAQAARGTGLGRQLVEAAVQWARATNRKVVPICGYARMVVHRDSSMHDVLA